MTQLVNVVSVKNGNVRVGCSSSACSGCHSETFCRKKDSTYEVNNTKGIDVKEGDLVEVEIPEGKAVFSVLMSLLFPLLMFIPGYFVGKSATENEVVMALFGFLFIGLGFLISWLFFRKRRKEYSPYITRKISTHPQDNPKGI